MTNDEQKERLNALMKDKSGMIKWAIIAVVAIVLLVVIFVGGYSSATKKQKAIISDLEKQVLELKAMEMDYIQIADVLGKTPKSIDNTIQRIKSKAKSIY